MAQDPVADLLRRSPVNNTMRADLWDAFQETADPDTLAERLRPLSVPKHVKAALWDLKAGTESASAPASEPTEARTWGDTARDVVIGAGKGAANTVVGLGELFRDYTPIGRISDAIHPNAFPQAREALQPTNTAQAVGYGAEQIGEFFTPTGAPAKIAKAANVAKSALLTQAQTGSPVAAAASAGLTAVLPGAGAAQRAAGTIERSAQKSVAQALGATKEWAKAEARRLAPEMLRRGVGGSRAAMLEHATEAARRVGRDLDDAYRAATQAGETVPGAVVRDGIQIARDALKVPMANGRTTVVPGTERVVRQLDRLDTFVAQLGDDIPVDRAAHVKRVWDRVISKAGLFGPKAGASATDSADAWALREASGAFRKLLNTNPTIEALNQETAFWTSLRKVLKETEQRVQAQGGGLTSAIGGSAGLAAGIASGDSMSDAAMKGLVFGAAGRGLVQVMQSPAFRTQVSGPLKQKLADALASGSTGRVESVARQIVSALPAQMRPAFAP